LQLKRPKAWGDLLSFKDTEEIIFSLPFTNISSYEIMRLHFITYDAYAALPEGTY
jgi:hypothetical protein